MSRSSCGKVYTIRHWLARHINVFFWLPVANIFGALIGKIQENLLKLDLAQISQTRRSKLTEPAKTKKPAKT